MDLDEVEILLVAHDLRLAKFKKSSVLDLVSLNLTHTAPSSSGPVYSQTASCDPPPPSQVTQQPSLQRYQTWSWWQKWQR